MFDLMRSVEAGQAPDNITMNTLVEVERRECERLLAIYARTLSFTSAEENARAPIHQLFWHRLTGGRLAGYYSGKFVTLPSHSEGTDIVALVQGRNKLGPYTDGGDTSVPYIVFETLLTYTWRINGVQQRYTLGELIERAIDVLNPHHAAFTIIGHGDAHFGNVFLEDQRDYLYFDPAFAGRHSPLLDVVKPLFHNVFATWMYFSFEIAKTLDMQVRIEGSTLIVEHNYTLTPVRQALLRTKQEYLLAPLLAQLRDKNALPENWLEFMQSALLCCPLLTMNLIDTQRMPVSVGWLGFALAVFMGNNDVVSMTQERDKGHDCVN
jgi:hypothetical protein